MGQLTQINSQISANEHMSFLHQQETEIHSPYRSRLLCDYTGSTKPINLLKHSWLHEKSKQVSRGDEEDDDDEGDEDDEGDNDNNKNNNKKSKFQMLKFKIIKIWIIINIIWYCTQVYHSFGMIRFQILVYPILGGTIGMVGGLGSVFGWRPGSSLLHLLISSICGFHLKRYQLFGPLNQETLVRL